MSLGYQGASTVASQPQDRILPPWLANPRNPAMSPHSRHLSHWWNSGREKKIRDGRGNKVTTYHACTYGIDRWIPAELMGCLSTKLTNRLSTKLTNCLTAKFVDCLTAKLVNRLTSKLKNRLTTKIVDRLPAKLVMVNLVKLHLTKFKHRKTHIHKLHECEQNSFSYINEKKSFNTINATGCCPERWS